jgi:hypothetical protein
MPRPFISRRPVRLAAVAATSLLIAALFGLGVDRLWSENTDHSQAVAAELKGITYLRPVVKLIGALADAQSAAVRGGSVDTVAVRAGLNAVDAADREHGDALGTRQRWIDLRARVETVLVKPGTERAAYRAFTDTQVLAADLLLRVGDTSELVRDPEEQDIYYLVDTALLRLPQALVSAGRASDIAALAGGRAPAGEDAVRVAVARHDVAQLAADVGAGLTKAIDATERSTLGANIAGPLDTFRAAVDDFAPPVVIGALADPVEQRDLTTAAARLRMAALALAAVVLDELDALVHGRSEELASNRRFMLGDATAMAVAALALLWLVAARTGPPYRRSTVDTGDGPPPAHTGETESGDLVDARDLRAFEELVHAGRAVQTRRWERDDDAG